MPFDVRRRHRSRFRTVIDIGVVVRRHEYLTSRP